MPETYPFQQVIGKYQWELVAPMSYAWNGNKLVVPHDFITDLASIPRFLWWLYPPMGRYEHAAILHDYIYTIKDRSRAEADGALLDVMEQDGVPAWQRIPIYLAVRLFGGLYWYG